MIPTDQQIDQLIERLHWLEPGSGKAWITVEADGTLIVEMTNGETSFVEARIRPEEWQQ